MMEDRVVDQPFDRDGCVLEWISFESAAAVWAFVVDAQYQIV
jgi:hypothetical protein